MDQGGGAIAAPWTSAAVRALPTPAARLVLVTAVLLGLFLMHGAPSMAAMGCHGALPAMAPVGSDPASMPAAESPITRSYAPVVQAAHLDQAMSGTLCLSTAARGSDPLSAAGLLAVFPMAVTFSFPSGRAGMRLGVGRRGPPGRGRQLLLEKCVQRM